MDDQVNVLRVRRHANGSVALNFNGLPVWSVHSGGMCTIVGNEVVQGDGWMELFVAQLPEPDGWANAAGSDGEDARTPYWRTSWGESVTTWIEGVEAPAWGLEEDLTLVRSDALKILAAVAACERYRAEARAAGAKDVQLP